MILRLFHSIFFSIIYLGKLSLSNKHSRVLVIVLISGLLFSLNIIYISSIYFLYLTYYYLYSKGIINSLRKKIFTIINNEKFRYDMMSILNKIKCEKLLLNNIILEDDITTFKVNYLVITEKALYNLIPLTYTEELLINELKNTKFYSNAKVSHLKRFNEMTSEILPIDLPLINILITQNKNCMLLIDENTTLNLMTIENAIDLIENNKNRSYKVPLKEIRNIILENKLWFLDRLFKIFTSLFTKGASTIILFISIPLIYTMYISIILVIYNGIIFIFQQLSDVIYTFLRYLPILK